jgi:glutaredoxin
MSQERRKKQEKRRKQEQPQAGLRRKIIIAVVIAAAFAGAFYLGLRKRTSRLDAFAQCTAAKGAKMYGAYWCPHCEEQKELFDSAFQYVNYLECGVKGDVHAQSAACKQAEVKHYPTWEFADQSRVEGKQSLPYLSDKTGCALP